MPITVLWNNLTYVYHALDLHKIDTTENLELSPVEKSKSGKSLSNFCSKNSF